MTTHDKGRGISLTAILGLSARRFLVPALAALALNGCGSGGGGGGEASSQPPQQSASGAALTIAEVTNPASPVIAAVTDKNGKEKFAIIGTKDSGGLPTDMTQVLYIAPTGDAGMLEIGADGLPASLSDVLGNKITFGNYTDSTVEVTVFDPAGNQVAGPVTISVDPTLLAQLKNISANAPQGAVPLMQGASFVGISFSGISTKDWIKTSVNAAGLGLGLAGCAGIILGTTAITGPLGVMVGAACVSTLIEAAQQIQGTETPPGYDYIVAGADGYACAVYATIGDFSECLDVIVDGIGLALDEDLMAPSTPSGLAISVIDQAKAAFYWNGSTDDVAVGGYRIYRDGTQIADTPITYHRDQEVVPGTQYCYRVEAYDKAGRVSDMSEALCVTIPLGPTPGTILYVCDEAGVLGKVDVMTGNVTIIGSMGIVMTDIAFAPNGDLYGVTFDSLYKINPATAAVTLIGSLGATGVNALAFRSDGTLYAANLIGQLYTVNTTTGHASYVGFTLYGSAGDLVFDTDGNLIMASSFGLIALNTTADTSGYVFQSILADTSPIGFLGLATGAPGTLYGLFGTLIVPIDTGVWQPGTIIDYSGHGLGGAYGATHR